MLCATENTLLANVEVASSPNHVPAGRKARAATSLRLNLGGEHRDFLCSTKRLWLCKEGTGFAEQAVEQQNLLPLQRLVDVLQDKKSPAKDHVARHRFSYERTPLTERAGDLLTLVAALRTNQTLTNPLNLVIVLSISFGAALAALANGYGLNAKAMRHRNLLWMVAGVANYRLRFKKFAARWDRRFVYKPFGGCGYIEYTSVEKSPFSKKLTHPQSLREALNPFFWCSQLKTALYNRVSTTVL